MKRSVLLLVFSVFLFSCGREEIPTADFPFFLHEPCMLLNHEQNNNIEGKYLIVLSVKNDTVFINLPDNFFVNANNFRNWYVGWGSKIPLYDAGVENIREIDAIAPDKKIILKKLLRGSGFPSKNQPVVFWNACPSGFAKKNSKPILDLHRIPNFHGNSMQFGSISYDANIKRWVMFFNECDNDTINTYVATTTNPLDWNASDTIKILFTPEDFKDIPWANGKKTQTPVITDFRYYNYKWYLFMHGYDAYGRRHIGMAVSDKSILGPYSISKHSVISPGRKGKWNDKDCFYAKVCLYKDKFLLFYNGRNHQGEENLGAAVSYDLNIWTEYSENPVLTYHKGWRSSPKVSEPAYLKVKSDSIFLLVCGAKKFKMGWWHHYITRRMYMDVQGNVDDTQLGLFLSTDGGKTFVAHRNNPVFTNLYYDDNENGHLGASFSHIVSDTAEYIFYIAKSDGKGYQLFVREKAY